MIIIAWNVVTKNFHATESLLDHLREKITGLEPYLNDFPPDSVHLRIELARDLKTELYNAALALRLPTAILRSQQSGREVRQAFDDAIHALANDIQSQNPPASDEAQKARDQSRYREVHA